MKTYIERFAERYYVVTSSNLHEDIGADTSDFSQGKSAVHPPF